MKSVYNIIKFDTKDLSEVKELLKLLGNERLKYMVRYLERLKYEIIKDTARVTSDVVMIRARDGGIQTIETIIADLNKAKTKEDFFNRATGEKESIKK